MTSFDDNIRQDKNNFNERLLKSVFKYQNKRNIIDFASFKNAIQNEIGEANFIGEDSYIKLFEEPIVIDVISSNIGEKKTQELYKQEDIPLSKATTKGKISIQFIQSKGYTKNNKLTRSYSRTRPQRFSDDQERFLKSVKPQLKSKKITTKQIVKKFNEKYKDNPRTEKSIKSKIYRS